MSPGPTTRGAVFAENLIGKRMTVAESWLDAVHSMGLPDVGIALSFGDSPADAHNTRVCTQFC
jgi:hypothetical protein